MVSLKSGAYTCWEVNYLWLRKKYYVHWCDDKKIRRHTSTIVTSTLLLLILPLRQTFVMMRFLWPHFFREIFFREIYHFHEKIATDAVALRRKSSSHGYFFFFFLSQNPRGANATGSFAQHSRLCDVHMLNNFSRPFLGLVYYYCQKTRNNSALTHSIHTYSYLCVDVSAFFGLTFGIINTVVCYKKGWNRWNYKS